MTATSVDDAGRNDFMVISLVGISHFVSHLYWIALPPLFIQLKSAFDVSYTELGALMAVMAGASTVVQVPVGFLVDRIGARPVLVTGIAVLAGSIALMGLATSFWMLMVLAALAGIGNSVFHPADYAILNASVSEKRMGRAFSIHTFAANFGAAVAPALMVGLSVGLGWRGALIAVGLAGLVLVAGILWQWNAIRESTAQTAARKSAVDDARTGWQLLMSRTVLIFFLFFAMLSFSAAAMQAFAVTALVNLHGTTLVVANTALSVYLFAIAGGTLLGGEISDRYPHHEVVAAGVFIMTAVLTAMLAVFDLWFVLLYLLMAVMGLGQGIIRPTRDLMLRAALPKGATGKVFGFVSTGIVAGAALGPIPFGYLIDIGRPELVFYVLAATMILCLFTVIVPKTAPEAPAPKPN